MRLRFISARGAAALVSVAWLCPVLFGGCAKEDTSGEPVVCTPSIELCNRTDDDCDGLVDEGDDGLRMTRDCSNGCGEGSETCVDGYWVDCTAPAASSEVCNGEDDDCDGVADNGFECSIGETQTCGTNVGTCEEGTQECGSSCTWRACKGDVEPQEEVCEGYEDEDCDGTVDNGCSCNDGETRECCGGVQIECENGVWPSCPAPPTEVCNGQDDDCSGVADDNLPESPFLIDEDPSGQDDCDHAYTEPFMAPFYEGDAAKSYTFYLVKEDGSEDRDFLSFSTADTTDAECAANTDYYECFELEVQLTKEPDGADLELCVYDIGSPGTSTSCSSHESKGCSGEGGNPPNAVRMTYEGGCGLFDSDERQYVVEVFYASGSPLSCDSYRLSIGWDADPPQPNACSF